MISVNDWFMSERDAMMTRGKKVSEDGWPRGLKGGGGTGEGMDNTQNQSRPWMMPLKLASLNDCLGWGTLYRAPGKSMYVLLSRTQAGPGRKVKQEQ